LNQRLEIIAREIEAMTDADQVQLLLLWPGVFLNFFWRHNIQEAAAQQEKLAAILEKVTPDDVPGPRASAEKSGKSRRC
jgi:hypothetical protein